MIVTCSPPFDQESQNGKLRDCSSPQEFGATAYYKCRPYYVPFDSRNRVTSSEEELHCDANGVWRGLRKFAAFRCKEGEIRFYLYLFYN